jgi:AAA+ superfamily predicted ATPase
MNFPKNILIFSSISLLLNSNNQLNNEDQKTSKIEYSDEQLERWLNKTSWDEITKANTLFEKRKFFEAYIAAMNGETLEKDENNLFEPIYPNSIKSSNQNYYSKKKHEIALENFKKEYIGTIPKQIEELIEYFAYYNENLLNNISTQNRILVHGEPGTGKTYLVKALSKALQIPYAYLPAGLFADKYIGASSRRIKATFNAIKDFKMPVLFFIDEIDAISCQRKGSTHDENRAMLTTLLVELASLDESPNVYVIAATNSKTEIDEAVMSRFSGSLCELKHLNKSEKAQLLEKYCKDHNLENYQGYPEALSQVLQAEHFTNRDLLYIVKKTKFMQHIAKLKDKDKSPEPLHKYFRKNIDETGKEANYWWRGTFGSGI